MCIAQPSYNGKYIQPAVQSQVSLVWLMQTHGWLSWSNLPLNEGTLPTVRRTTSAFIMCRYVHYKSVAKMYSNTMCNMCIAHRTTLSMLFTMGKYVQKVQFPFQHRGAPWYRWCKPGVVMMEKLGADLKCTAEWQPNDVVLICNRDRDTLKVEIVRSTSMTMISWRKLHLEI